MSSVIENIQFQNNYLPTRRSETPSYNDIHSYSYTPRYKLGNSATVAPIFQYYANFSLVNTCTMVFIHGDRFTVPDDINQSYPWQSGCSA